MKITDVEAIYLRLPEIKERSNSSQDTLLIKITTDSGLIGWGEVDSSPLVAKAVIEAPMSHAIMMGLKPLFRNLALPMAMVFAIATLPAPQAAAEMIATDQIVNEELAAGDAGAALALDPLGPALYPLLELGGEEALQQFALPLLEVEDHQSA